MFTLRGVLVVVVMLVFILAQALPAASDGSGAAGSAIEAADPSRRPETEVLRRKKHRHPNQNVAKEEEEEEAEEPEEVSLLVVAGQEAVLTSADGRAAVSVRRFRMPRIAQLSLRVWNQTVFRPTPGVNLLGAVYQVELDEGATVDLPTALNLGIHYTDREARGLDRQRLVIGLLDRGLDFWAPIPSATDPANNYVSATITRAGLYAVYRP